MKWIKLKESGRQWIALALLGLLITLATPFAAEASNSIVVSVDAPGGVTVGEDFAVRLHISSVKDLDALVCRFRFNPDIIKLTTQDADGKGLYDSISGGEIGGKKVGILAAVEKEPGLVGVTAQVQPALAGATGDGTVMKLLFHAVAPGTSDIGLEHHSLSNTNAQSLEAEWGGSSVTVYASSVPPSANMEVTRLRVNPGKVQPEEQVSISADIRNRGSGEGSYEVVLKINGVTEDTKEVTLAGGEATTVTFTVSREVAGEYLMEVDGLSQDFIVEAASPPAGSGTEAASPPAGSGTEAPVTPPPVGSGINWTLIGGLIGAVTVIVVVVILWRRARFG